MDKKVLLKNMNDDKKYKEYERNRRMLLGEDKKPNGKDRTITVAFYIVVILLLLFLIISYLTGCQTPERPETTLENRLPEKGVIEVIKHRDNIKTIYENLGWLERMFIVGAALSVVACFLKFAFIGIPVFIGNCAGLALISLRIYYGQWMGIVALVAGCLVAGYAIYANKKAFVEIIAGGEQFKNVAPSEDALKIFENSHRKTQKHKFTKKIVDDAQKKIRRK